ncbi:lytic transglycosylase domain-containing protein [Pararhodobacter sp.]|uniref:lytic transglycosylase domain-containing protein n=1 Tax=Pararhodobacter sp. TaxID=2127056 RepID=UPI002AFFE169|nr:transglycosylase SLT domain-containing protein [Pararhodobacter sp.]
MHLRRAVLAILASFGLAFPGVARDTPPPARTAGAIGALVEAVRSGDIDAVNRLREAAGPIGVRIATWRILRGGIAGDLATYATFDATHADWPGMDLLRQRAESRLAGQPAQAVLDWFATRTPQTTIGTLALIAAYRQTDRDPAELLQDLWLHHDLSEAQETALLASDGALLAPLHTQRLDDLLWRGEISQAERLLPRVDADHRALARARIALQNRADGVDILVAAVPAALSNDPGLAYDRFRWRQAAGFDDSATDLMREVSPDGLGRPKSWAGQRLRLARNALDDGNYQLSYDLAAHHGLTDGVMLAELEWLAGYVALRHLNDPEQAAHHFAALRQRVSSPISLGRAGYWEGRALEAAGREAEARAAYAFGAQHQTAFYGQLAAERLGQTLDPALIADPDYPDWHDTPLAQNDVLQAALLLHSAGQWHEARRFVIHLASTLTDEAQLGALAQLWLDRGEPHFTLKIAKEAIQNGILLPRAYFPLTGLEQADLLAPAALVLAIARRESEFNAAVVSHADARGLLQILPSTGRHTARRLGIAFDEDRLTRDGPYNAVLGAGYLQEMSEQFGGTLSLVAAAYNAGPGRPLRWMRENGDPRTDAVDPVDWVEMIPFNETRNYVMRVTESLVIYRAILAGQVGPIGLTDILRGRD